LSKEDIMSEVEDLLKKLDLEKSAYTKKSVDPKSAHTKTIEAFNDFWLSKHPYREQYSIQDIDFLGKERIPEGRILLAMEVDAGWFRATESCVRLANIRSENKIWVYITSEEKAKENFKLALKDIKKS
jgi:hypothetical protein